MDDALLVNDAEEREAVAAAPHRPPGFGTRGSFWLSLVALILLMTADGVLCVLLFDIWGQRYALFINQGTAFVYIIASAVALAYLSRRGIAANNTDTTTKRAKWYSLVAIGLMNGGANFFMAISQPHTPGLSQTLLLQLGVPLVLVLSWAFLGKRPSAAAAASASLVVVGTLLSSLRGVLGGDATSSAPPIQAFTWAILLFAVAQIFLAAEKVYEERLFTKHAAKLHPMTMFAWTLTTQFILGWALYPIQSIPALGGVSLSKLPALVRDGALCTLGRGSGCDGTHAAIFWVYVTVDFWAYYFGLWVIQRGGASLMAVAISVALPLQQLVLCSHALVGKWAEAFFWGDGVALVLVLLGFVGYQVCSPEGRAARRAAAAGAHAEEEEAACQPLCRDSRNREE